ncbi:hypothetical protein SprV_0301221700 [Sparganum proliferum]
MPTSPVGDAYHMTLITVGFNQHGRKHEAEEGGSKYAALLRSVGHCECLGDCHLVADARYHPVLEPIYHVRGSLGTAEFLHYFPQSIEIHLVYGFPDGQQIPYRWFRGGIEIYTDFLTEVLLEMAFENASEDLPRDVEKRDFFVDTTKLLFPLPFEVMDDGRVLEILKDLSSTSHYPEERREEIYQSVVAVLVDFVRNHVRSL